MTLETADVGRIYEPALTRTTYLPGETTPQPRERMALVSYSVRDGGSGTKKDASFGLATVTTEALRDKWRDVEAIQQAHETPEAFIASVERRLGRYAFGMGHNERVQNGAAVLAKYFWGATLPTPQYHVYNAAPGFIGLAKNTFAVAITHKSIGSDTGAVTTNEWTSNGLTRAGAIAPTSPADTAIPDGTASFQFANTFTDITGVSTVYGTGLFDTLAAANSNMYAEFVFLSAIALAINDQLGVVWLPQI